MKDLLVSEIMTKDPYTTMPDTLIPDAVKDLIAKGVSSFPVMEGDKLVGIVTEGDLISPEIPLEYPSYLQFIDGVIMSPVALRRFEDRLKKASGAYIKDVMTKKVVTVKDTDEVHEAARLFADEKVSVLPVMNADKQLVGIMTKHDIVKALAK